ncbi:hypothetical protein FB45DRAFT_915536 [Roridomyces roridus]|uniref:Uncharacterized protein n=1 Tax=Roridomyces roridus TaxID=1738132 RepID=A0AAD7BTH3_9AGAR|nr:hypothetical protein FB45DRAFT_915536 [Roridomyces roridus]
MWSCRSTASTQTTMAATTCSTDDPTHDDLSLQDELTPAAVCIVRSSSSDSDTTLVSPTASQSKTGKISSSPTQVHDHIRPEKSETQQGLFCVSNAVYARGGTVRSLPDPLETFLGIAETEGMAFLFKPFGMDQLYRLLACHRPIRLSRPPGYGIEMFTAIFMARVDNSTPVPFDTFHATECTLDSTIGLHQDTVLLLDFGGVGVGADLDAALTAYVYARCQHYSEHHAMRNLPPIDCFLPSSSPAASIISHTVGRSLCKQLSVILLIENFDTVQAPPAEAERVLNAFFHKLENMVVFGNIKGLVLFSDEEKQPVPNLHHTVDITHHPAFQTAVGCTEEDVLDLDNALAKSFPEAEGDVLEMLKEKGVISPFLFTRADWDKDLLPLHPARAAKLCMTEANRGVYPLEPVMEVLTEKYSLNPHDSVVHGIDRCAIEGPNHGQDTKTS